jgi:hypothetical protein
MDESDEVEFEEWVIQQRARVEEYLSAQGIAEPKVGPWPAFEVAPVFAIWAVESKKVAGKIGWWAFSGDCPTDYVSEDGQCHPRKALQRLLDQWRSYVTFMKNGKQPPDASIGEGTNLRELAELLKKRIDTLTEWILDDSLWEDR